MHFTTPMRPCVRALVVVIASLGTAAIGATPAATNRTPQRTAFLAAWQAAQSGQAWQPLAKGLRHYPLYPYLEAVALQNKLKTASTAQIDAYLKRYSDWIPAARLRSAELHWAASQQDWKTFRHFYRSGLGETLTCDDLQARLAKGKPLHFKRDLTKLWHKTHLPSACTPVLDAAFAQGLLTPQRIWQRIEHAADYGRSQTITQSAQWLTGTDAKAAQRIADALRDPTKLLKQAAQFPNTKHSREAVSRALTGLAGVDSQQAQTFWQSLAKQFTFDHTQRRRILSALALYNAVDAGPDALARLMKLPAAAQTQDTREWRVRVAIVHANWKAAQTALDALTHAEKQRGVWRYWQARIAEKFGHSSAALKGYTALAQRATFYGYLAADRAHLPYSICPKSIQRDAAVDHQLKHHAGLQRAFEFFAIGLLPQARREWDRAFAKLTPKQQRQAAALASRRGWYDRAVFALGKSGDLRYYALRFPLADKHRVLAAADAAGIDPAWAFAIIRAETAWQTDARSGANARGLMQLLPSTAKMVARRNDLPYHGSASLSDPAINIPLGTQYLAHLAQRFDGSPWLASAAYNAGPGNVRRWIDRRSSLDPERFILTIPFPATRAYVTRVLSFATLYSWRLHGKPRPVSSRLPAIGTPYDQSVDPKRKSVACQLPKPDARSARHTTPSTKRHSP